MNAPVAASREKAVEHLTEAAAVAIRDGAWASAAVLLIRAGQVCLTQHLEADPTNA